MRRSGRGRHRGKEAFIALNRVKAHVDVRIRE